MYFEKVLVPLDGSELAEAVLPYALDIAQHHNSVLILLQVVPLPSQVIGYVGTVNLAPAPPPDLSAVEESLQAEVRQAEGYLSRKAAELMQKGIKAQWVVVRGRPGEAIVQSAKEQNADLIAISTHGRSGLGRMIFGSVADHVLRNSGLPVLVIKPDMKGEGEG